MPQSDGPRAAGGSEPQDAGDLAESLETPRRAAVTPAAEHHEGTADRQLRESHARFRRLFDANMVGVVCWSLSGELTEANDEFLRIVGMTRADFDRRGLRWDDLTPPEWRAVSAAKLDEVRATGQCTPFEKEYFRTDGSRAPVLVASAAFDGPDRSTGIAVTLDLTERKRVDARLASKRHILEKIATGAPLIDTLLAIVALIETHWPGAIASIMLLDEQGRLHVAAAPGLPAEYSAAIDGVRIGPSAGSCGTAAFRREAVIVSDLATDPLWADYRHLALPHGLRACWSVPIPASSGDILGTIAVYYREQRTPGRGEEEFAHDAAASLAAIAIERHRTEAALREQSRALAAANRNKDEFLATLAHELRNPLAAIQAAVHVLKTNGPGDPRLNRPHAVIERQVAHIIRLVDDLRDLSQIARGKVRLDKQPVDIAAIAAEAAETVRPIVESRHQTLSLTLPGEPAVVEGDSARLAQIVLNLLNNATKYTPQSGRISITVAREDPFVALRVRDSGLGISPDILPRIFDLFAQADETIDHAQGGLGIGLNVVKSLVAIHGGSVSAASEGLGCGSEFEVRLPLAIGVTKRQSGGPEAGDLVSKRSAVRT